jgi:hypothetical protein
MSDSQHVPAWGDWTPGQSREWTQDDQDAYQVFTCLLDFLFKIPEGER